jgi:hypothetical protein
LVCCVTDLGALPDEEEEVDVNKLIAATKPPVILLIYLFYH